MPEGDNRNNGLAANIALIKKRTAELGIDDSDMIKALDAILASENKYHMLVEMTGVGYLILDSQGKVVDANQEYVRLSGHKDLKDILGRSVVEWTAEGAKERNAQAVAMCVKDRGIRGFITEYTGSGAESTFVEISAAVEGEGASSRIISLCRDVTERKKVEEALKESEKRFMDVLYASSDAILLIDNNIFVDCNEATARMLGYANRKEFLMVHPSKLSPDAQPDRRKSFEKAEEMMKIALEKGYHRFEWMHKKASGEDFPVEVSLTPISLHGKTVIHCVWRDLTEFKKVEKAEQDHLRELEFYFKAALDREDRIMELKKEVDDIKKQLGK